MGTVSHVNHWIANEEVKSEEYRVDIDPGKFDEVVTLVARGSKEVFDAAAQAAHEAQEAWGSLPAAERVNYLKGMTQLPQERVQELAELLVREAGHDLTLATMDVLTPPGVIEFNSTLIEDFMTPQIVEDDISWTSIDKVPKGVACVVSPWNMPIGLASSKMIPALMTGNTVVVKPPSDAPAALTLLLQEYARALPPGVINVVNGSAAELGQAIIDNEYVRMIGFTGGTQGGKELYAGCAKTMKSAVLELSGNDAAIILDDADLDLAVTKLLRSSFMRSGQVCFAAKRIYVDNSVMDEFFDKMSEAVNTLVVGYGLDPKTTLGPVMNKRQYDHVTGLIEDARKAGAVVRELGSKSTPELWDQGYYIMPHVLKVPSNDIAIVQKEQFGPAMPLIGFDTIDEAICYANDSTFGLCSSVWTKDTERGVQVAKRIQAGQTLINGHRLEDLGMGIPFGGIKNSGIGRDHAGAISFQDYIDYHPIRVMKQ